MQKNQTSGFTKNYGTVIVTVRYYLLISVAICEAHQNKYRYEAILIVPDVTISLYSSSCNFSASFSLLRFLFYLSATQKQHWKPRNRQKRGESKTTEGKITLTAINKNGKIRDCWTPFLVFSFSLDSAKIGKGEKDYNIYFNLYFFILLYPVLGEVGAAFKFRLRSYRLRNTLLYLPTLLILKII